MNCPQCGSDQVHLMPASGSREPDNGYLEDADTYHCLGCDADSDAEEVGKGMAALERVERMTERIGADHETGRKIPA